MAEGRRAWPFIVVCLASPAVAGACGAIYDPANLPSAPLDAGMPGAKPNAARDANPDAMPDASPDASDASPANGDAGLGPEDATGTVCEAAFPPSSALRSVSLVLTGVDFGDESSSDWATIGFNLDGKCSTSSSTDVCTPLAGGSPAVHMNGVGGIDNSFGENFCQLLDTTTGNGGCSTEIEEVQIATDDAGTGTLAIRTQNGLRVLEFPIHDVYVAIDGGGGVLGAVAPTAGVVTAVGLAVANVSPSLCSDLGSFASQVEQTSDILSDGSNSSGMPCNAISIGMTFDASSSFDGSFPAVPDPCPDASQD
jgi:hypothetical protein